MAIRWASFVSMYSQIIEMREIIGSDANRDPKKPNRLVASVMASTINTVRTILRK
jgi:hypothetical protein